MKLIKQEQGAMQLKLVGNNHMILNWANNMIEIWNNGKKEFVIDMNQELKDD
jgi:hypothetical protein